MSKRMDDGNGGKGVGINAFATRLGVSSSYVSKLCRQGRIDGARKHPVTGQWWIYPPARIIDARP